MGSTTQDALTLMGKFEGKPRTVQETDEPIGDSCRVALQRNIIASAGLIAVIGIVSTSPHGVWDAWSILCSGQILFMYVMQNMFLEWPTASARLHFVLLSSYLVLLEPTILQAAGVWESVLVQVAALIVNFLFMANMYCCLVRPPGSLPAAGSLKGKTVLLTGANGGVGLETARSCAIAGAKVICAHKPDMEAHATEGFRRLVAESKGKISEDQFVLLPVDLSHFASVRSFAAAVEERNLQVDLLILNAGIMRNHRAISREGIEEALSTNHFGHFLLAQLLMPGMLAAEARGASPRVVVLASALAYQDDYFDFSEVQVAKDDQEKSAMKQKPYSLFHAYGQSKLANVLFTVELARRLQAKGSKIPAYAVHPGEVATDIVYDMFPALVAAYSAAEHIQWIWLKTRVQGCACTMHVAAAPELATTDGGLSGSMWLRCAPAPLSRVMKDEATASKLWTASQQITGESFL